MTRAGTPPQARLSPLAAAALAAAAKGRRSEETAGKVYEKGRWRVVPKWVTRVWRSGVLPPPKDEFERRRREARSARRHAARARLLSSPPVKTENERRRPGSRRKQRRKYTWTMTWRTREGRTVNVRNRQVTVEP